MPEEESGKKGAKIQKAFRRAVLSWNCLLMFVIKNHNPAISSFKSLCQSFIKWFTMFLLLWMENSFLMKVMHQFDIFESDASFFLVLCISHFAER